jgi:GAF domain-containing protein
MLKSRSKKLFYYNFLEENNMKSYTLLNKQLSSILEGETNNISILSNASALLNEFLDNINWVGFYLYNSETNQLELGPFQGKVACSRIPMNKGVCGTSAHQRKTQRVPDVHQFEGHIACDSASNSEIVIPIIINDNIFGVLDIDSPIFDRFFEEDQKYLEEFVQILEEVLANGI